jgi:hypothetical protein
MPFFSLEFHVRLKFDDFKNLSCFKSFSRRNPVCSKLKNQILTNMLSYLEYELNLEEYFTTQ